MLLRELLPHDVTVTIHRELSSSDKSHVHEATWDGAPVVIKVLESVESYWQQRFVHEIAAHQVFATHHPPVSAARLRYTDGHRLLVLEHIVGTPLSHERYPEPVPAGPVESVLATLTRLHTWPPPENTTLSQVSGDEAMALDRLDHAGWGTPTDRAMLRELLDQTAPTELAHGDPVPSNLMLTPTGETVLLDWEFAGLRRPGWDLALLHTLLAHTPAAQQRIAASASDTAVQAGFLLNRALVIAREWRIHTDLPPGDLREQRLALLRHAWSQLHHELHRRSA